jgi:membrane protein YqaA with SNARE-associated domain
MTDSINIFLTDYGYYGLFISAFLSGSILPFASEAILCTLVLKLDVNLCIIYATIGNFLGGLTCYYLGYSGNLLWIKKWLKITEDQINRTIKKVNTYGAYLGFLVFLPIIGDLIAVTAGYLRTNVKIFSLTMLTGKLLRYTLLAYTTIKVIQW